MPVMAISVRMVIDDPHKTRSRGYAFNIIRMRPETGNKYGT
jgi:hypothetical protein